ncbi:amidase [Enterovirga aerilata]|uniref:Amidase n=1 Tax=Enterovirga aerilata TaxID=2730920 RepID=A0A849I3W2_9HYPH|nr:amidase [Enterovirga sp. DB1703]NNM71055.1 amidase [Enterovirga sp. DB1703]
MLSLVDLLARIGSGALTPESAFRLTLEAIAMREGEIGAFAHLDRDARPSGRGPLNGIAVGVKDIIDTAGMPTEMGSPIYAGWRPKADAPVVSALKRAGATVIGKTTTTAFASVDPTRTRNPHGLSHTPGGSSAGSAAAVGAGMVPLAVGTQTGGSVIRPAAYCGAAAIKPSFRLLPTVGVKCFAWTLDTVGLFAAGTADLALALELVSGRPMPLDPPARPRIGVVTQDFAGEPEPAAAAALERAALLLSRSGAEIWDVKPPSSFAAAWAAHGTIQDFEAKHALAWEYDHHRAEIAPLLGEALDKAQAIPAAAYDDARRLANRARRDARELFAELDAVVTYAAPGPAPEGYGSTGDSRYNRLWTLLGTPCVNVPGLVREGGLPVGVQVIAPFARDGVALALAHLLERAQAAS